MNSAIDSNLHHDIARALRTRGAYLGEIDAPVMQRVVDAQWAAHLAGRTIGARVRVVIHEQRSPGDRPRVLLEVTSRSPLPT